MKVYLPATARDVKRGVPLWHVHCQGRVNERAGTYECMWCHLTWKSNYVQSLVDSELRWYFTVEQAPKVMLVWVTEGRDRFVCEVPYDPEDPRERVKW